MILVSFVILILASGKGVRPEDVAEWGSGETPVSTTTTGSIFLIDENGDIPSAFADKPELNENMTTLSESEMVFNHTMDMMNGNESATSMADVMENGTTTISSPTSATDITTVIADKTTYETTTTELPTTETPTESDTTTTTFASTVTSTTSTTMDTSPVVDETTTVTSKQTSTSSSTTTTVGKTEKSAGRMSPKSTTEATLLPEADRQSCTFLDADFYCSEEVMCYGEGEIDCTEEEDKPFIDKISLSSISEGYSDYDEAGSDTIGTFPPNLVGVASPKKIPFFYNIRSFATTELDMNESSKTEGDNSSTALADTTESTSTNVSVAQSEPMDMGEDSTTETESATYTVQEQVFTSTAAPKAVETIVKEGSTFPSTETTSEFGNVTIGNSLESNGTSDEPASGFIRAPNTNIQNVAESSENFEQPGMETGVEIVTPSSSQVTEDKSDSMPKEKVNLRRKRNFFSESDSASPSKSMLHTSVPLEKLNRKFTAKLCRVSGDLVCSPKPMTAFCRGKTFCQATRRIAETAESSSARGLKTWVIVVIAACGLFGFLTVCIIIYLAVTSRCKKLKVQPTPDVTTLNYITRKGENNEMA